MIFKVNFNAVNYNYDLGVSPPAAVACEKLNKYKISHEYEDLISIFANLAWIVNADPVYKSHACSATRTFALSVFPTLNSIYERFFVANSVTSVYARAGHDIPKDWLNVQAIYGTMISRSGLKIDEAKKAGIAVAEIV